MSRFILTGFPRSGTTVVSGTLITHPEVLFYGELLNNMPEVRQTESRRITLSAGWQLERPLGWEVPPCSLQGSGKAYIESIYSRETPFKATGFKLMYDQVLTGPNSDIWQYIADNSDIKIIRTKRENVLEMICSYVRAHVTRRWHNTGGPMPNPKFVIPPQEFSTLIKKMESMPDVMRIIHETHSVLDLDYDRISTDFQGCMSDIYAFLEVSPQTVDAPRLKKIAQLKPNEELHNYDELKQLYQNTEYARFFIH